MRENPAAVRAIAVAAALLFTAGLVSAYAVDQGRTSPAAAGSVELAALVPDAPGVDATSTIPPMEPVLTPTTSMVQVTPTTPPMTSATTPPMTPATTVAAAPSSAGLPEPDCARLPADIPRSGLRGGQWLARRVDGATANYNVYIEALPCNVYDGEGLQITVYAAGPQAAVEFTVDYGDGSSWYMPGYDPCSFHLPATFPGSGQYHVYALAGTYTVTARIVLHPCAGTPETITLSLPVQRVAGSRPYPAPEVPRV